MTNAVDRVRAQPQRLRLRSDNEEADQDPDNGNDNERRNPLLQVLVTELGRAAGRLAF